MKKFLVQIWYKTYNNHEALARGVVKAVDHITSIDVMADRVKKYKRCMAISHGDSEQIGREAIYKGF